MTRTSEPLLEKAIKEGRRSKPYALRNATGLPDIAIQYCEDRESEYPNHAENTYSVTTLKKSYKEYLFSKTLADVAGRDVQDLFASADGTAVHDALQLTALKRPDRYIPEERINDVIIAGGVNEYGSFVPELVISGEYDCFDKQESTLIDYKNTKQSIIDKNFSGLSNEFEMQLVLYSWLFFRKYGFYPKRYLIVARAKDHSKVKQVETGSDKHACQIKYYTITDEMRDKYLEWARQKTKNMYLMENGLMDVPDCTPDEVWRSDNIIVSKQIDYDALERSQKGIPEKDGKMYKPPKAAKVCADYSEAQAFRRNNMDKGYRIYRRMTDPMKCKHYCQFRDICNQYKEKESTHPSFYDDITDGELPF